MLYAAAIAASTRYWLWDLAPEPLKDVLRAHFKRVVLSILGAVPVIVFGTWLLRFEVTQHDMNNQVAPLINWPLITVLAFVSNLLLPYKDRELSRRLALKRWIIVSFGHSCITYSAYSILVNVAGLRYLFVSVGLTVVLCPASYVLRNIWIFVAEIVRPS